MTKFINVVETGKNIRKMIESKGLTMDDIADFVRKPTSEVTAITNGEVLPDMQTLLAMARILRVSADDLVIAKSA